MQLHTDFLIWIPQKHCDLL